MKREHLLPQIHGLKTDYKIKMEMFSYFYTCAIFTGAFITCNIITYIQWQLALPVEIPRSLYSTDFYECKYGLFTAKIFIRKKIIYAWFFAILIPHMKIFYRVSLNNSLRRGGIWKIDLPFQKYLRHWRSIFDIYPMKINSFCNIQVNVLIKFAGMTNKF